MKIPKLATGGLNRIKDLETTTTITNQDRYNNIVSLRKYLVQGKYFKDVNQPKNGRQAQAL